MNTADDGDPYAELKRNPEDYRVFDQHFKNVGRVDGLYTDDNDRPLYVGIKRGLLAFESTPIPVEIMRINDKRQLIEVASSHERIRHAPSFGEGEVLTPESEEKVRAYFGLRPPRAFADRPTSGTVGGATDEQRVPDDRIDLLPGERKAAGSSKTPTAPRPAPDPSPTDTEPGKEWARGTQGHEAERLDRASRVHRKKRV